MALRQPAPVEDNDLVLVDVGLLDPDAAAEHAQDLALLHPGELALPVLRENGGKKNVAPRGRERYFLLTPRAL
jgi:hypothetical protein